MKGSVEEKISNVFETKIRPTILLLETDRKKVQKKLLLVLGLTSVLFLILGLSIPALGGLLLPSGPFILMFQYKLIIHGFRLEFKKLVVREVFSVLVPGSIYAPQGSISENTFRESSLRSTQFNKFLGEDLVKGQIGGLEVEFSELTVSEVRKKNDGKKEETSVFKGLFFSFSLKNDLKQSTLLLNDPYERHLGKGITRFLQKHSAPAGHEIVNLESGDFEKRYAVYSNDQIRARVLLKPSVISNLTEFGKRNTNRIDLSIRDKKLYVALSSQRDHFEPRLFGEVISLSDVREIFHLINLIHELQEELELSEAS